MRTYKLLLGALPALLLLLLGATPSQAITISAGDFTSGDSVLNAPSATFTASPGDFLVDGSTVGVDGGFQDDEFDVSGDSLTIAFSGGGATIDEIVIGRLYALDVEGDEVDEAGRFLLTLFGASTSPCTTCDFDATGSFDGNGSPASGPNGTWTFSDPFDGAILSQLVLQALDAGDELDSDNSDFALVSITYTPEPLPEIPEPGTAGLLGLGLLGLTLSGRARSQRS